jgi:hypothetical protein
LAPIKGRRHRRGGLQKEPKKGLKRGFVPPYGVINEEKKPLGVTVENALNISTYIHFITSFTLIHTLSLQHPLPHMTWAVAVGSLCMYFIYKKGGNRVMKRK